MGTAQKAFRKAKNWGRKEKKKEKEGKPKESRRRKERTDSAE